MEQAPTTPPWLDKGLWVAILTPVLVLLNQKFGLTLDAVSIVGLVLPVAVYIAGHKYKAAQDNATLAAQMAARAAAGATASALNQK